MDANLENASYGSPTRLSQVFPLMCKEASYVQRSIQDVTRTTTTKSGEDTAPVKKRTSLGSLLSVADPPSRTRSADLLNVNDPSDVGLRGGADGTGGTAGGNHRLERPVLLNSRKLGKQGHL